ncbi:hypothetical protein FUAX_00050 [Fulvitalea axinellae]|uniref:SbsA Ig-like domain-containing protein n=2 Tax=Fulvitalea axinellae TaxID=1182444 RepID=A0AAU9CCX2_9BACT|nr:hypothetical protein FUAX_00050 [Fulvitalea axinellae]
MMRRTNKKLIARIWKRAKRHAPLLLAGGVWAGLISSSGCASQRALTGGPKDTIPPMIESSTPPNLSTNFNGKKVRIQFDEYVQLKNAKKDLIITPSSENEYDIKLKGGRTFEITFDQPLDSNTTYTLNFQEVVQDVTEKNVLAENVFTFSTGPELDSMFLHGKVKDLLTNQPEEGAVVALYRSDDTLNIFNSKPLYFTKTDKEGIYTLAHIREGKYMLYTYQDKNQNLIFDPKKEKAGFHDGIIELNHEFDSLKLSIVDVNMDSLYTTKSLISGTYFVTSFNKPIKSYRTEFDVQEIFLPNNLLEDNKTIRFYNTRNMTEEDSLRVKVTAMDSVHNEITYETFVKFRETKRKKAKLEQKSGEQSRRYISNDFSNWYWFSKPIEKVNYDSAYFFYDSLNVLPITEEDFTWNDTRNIVSLRKNLELDTIIHPDTVEAPIFKTVKLNLKEGTFVSIEQDSATAIDKSYSFAQSENVGSILGKIITDEKSYILQLLDDRYNLIDERINPKDYAFLNVDPGKYYLRILVDKDGSGEWDPGNIMEVIPPEPVYFYPGLIVIRANWERTGIDMQF